MLEHHKNLKIKTLTIISRLENAWFATHYQVGIVMIVGMIIVKAIFTLIKKQINACKLIIMLQVGVEILRI
jgi:hypothetical protein